MPPHIGREMFSATCLYCQLETSLANWHGIKVFNVTQKSHFLVHIGWQSQHHNPRITWCLMGDDFKQKVRHIPAKMAILAAHSSEDEVADAGVAVAGCASQTSTTSSTACNY